MKDISSILHGMKSKTAGNEAIDPPSAYKKPITGLCDPDCEVCNGLGYVKSGAEVGDPNFGRIFPCPNSNPFNRYKNLLGLDAIEHNFEWLDILDIGNALEAVNAVNKVVEQSYGWVTLWGDYGVAKTLILKIAVAEFCRKTKRPAAYTRMAEIIDHLRGAFDAVNPSVESQMRLDTWSDLPLLSIDEFDRVRSTEYANERRFVLMDRRYEQACRQQSITLLATNADPSSMEGYLADRIFDGRFTVIHLTGHSIRPMMTY